jgi:hypothetical protein
MWTLDPFGNYLCQKLLEYSTDEQRNLICESVAGDLVTISLNMHGTRAVQKMIDFLSTQRQVSACLPILPHCTTCARVAKWAAFYSMKETYMPFYVNSN